MTLPEIVQAEIPNLVTSGGHSLNVTDVLRIDPGNLTAELLKQATLQSFIGYQHAEAQLLLTRAQRNLKKLKADKWFYYREHLELLYGVKPTLDALEMAVERDKEIQMANEELAVLENREKQFYVLREAFQTRKDALIHLSADERIERKLRPVD